MQKNGDAGKPCLEDLEPNPATNFMLGWWVEWGQTFYCGCAVDMLQVACAIPKLPIERPGLAFGGIGNIKECKRMTNFKASHFIAVALGNHANSPHYSKMAHWAARAGIWMHWKQNQGMQKQAPISWWVERLRPTFFGGSTWKSYK